MKGISSPILSPQFRTRKDFFDSISTMIFGAPDTSDFSTSTTSWVREVSEKMVVWSAIVELPKVVVEFSLDNDESTLPSVVDGVGVVLVLRLVNLNRFVDDETIFSASAVAASVEFSFVSQAKKKRENKFSQLEAER